MRTANTDVEMEHAMPSLDTDTALIGHVLPHRHVRLIDEIKAIGTACLLHLGAHPDDEDCGLIAYLSRGHHVRTVYWSATRGEGGQNRTGPERGEALGVVRTWESLAARGIDGGEVRYGPFYDFGFSKSGADTLHRWGRARVVREMVRAIRQVQPLVVVCRWSGGPEDGHGHHQAIGLVVGEAFHAAGDSTQFPELGLPPWQPQKLYRSAAGDWQPGEDGSFGVIVEEYERAGLLRIDTGSVDPGAGMTYQEQAHLAVNQHRSQGMAFVPEPGPYYYYYHRLDERRPSTARETSFFDGLDPMITGLADYPGAAWRDLSAALATVQRCVQEAARVFRPDHPSTSVPALLDGLAALLTVLRDLDAQPLAPDAAAALARQLSRTAGQIPAVVTACLHVRAECLLDVARTTPGRDVTITVRVWNGGPLAVRVEQVRLRVPAGWQVTRIGAADPLPRPTADVATEIGYVVRVPADASPGVPYWLRDPRDPYRYQWPETEPCLGLPFDEPPVWAEIALGLDGHRWAVRTPAVHRAGLVGGSRELQLAVLPPLALAPRQRREIVPVADRDTVLHLDVRVDCIEVGGATARLSIIAPGGWAAESAPRDLVFAAGGDTHNARITITVPADADPGAYTLHYDLVSAGRACPVEVIPVRLAAAGSPADGDNCVAETHLVHPATVAVDLVDATFVGTLRYGYVRGMDEQILPALARFELTITELTDDQLKYADLSEFNAIVIGPNAYNVRPAVRDNASRLLDYAREGGALLVQHQGYGYDADGLAPYWMRHRQPHDRVTDPRAPVQVLDPEHPILRFPNEIGPVDFDGWVHDRGMYLVGEWDRRYSAVLACGDVGEQPCGGGLLTTTYGRGTYVYAAYSFFRQIPAGVPGAVRLFANLLGLAEVRVRERMERLAAVELFRVMTASQLYEAARIVSERWVGAGCYLAREGERGHELFVVVDGTIDVVKQVPGDAERLLHVARPGEALGELALLADISRTASLRAATDAVVLVIRDDAFYEWLRRHPDLSRQIMQRLAEQLAAKNAER